MTQVWSGTIRAPKARVPRGLGGMGMVERGGEDLDEVRWHASPGGPLLMASVFLKDK